MKVVENKKGATDTVLRIKYRGYNLAGFVRIGSWRDKSTSTTATKTKEKCKKGCRVLENRVIWIYY